MIALGLDLSLTGTGWATLDTDTGKLSAGTIHSTNKGMDAITEYRLNRVVDEIAAIAPDADLTCIEDLAHGAIGGKKSERAALYWMTRVRLHRRGMAFAAVNVAHLKIYATGTSRAANKTVMQSAIQGRVGMDRCPEFADDNQVDAAWLALLAADRLGCPLVPMPQVSRAVLDRIAWPDLLSDDAEAS